MIRPLRLNKYKHLAVVTNENFKFSITADILADSAGRALGTVIGKSKYLSCSSLKKPLYSTGDKIILNYSAEIWGVQEYKSKSGSWILFRFTQIYTNRGEMGLNSTKYDR